MREKVWAAQTLDAVVLVSLSLAGIVIILGLLLALLFPNTVGFRQLRRDISPWLSATAIALTIFVGYASFRNQSRLSAEAALRQSGYDLYGIEMEHPEIRCLYINHGYSDPGSCLDKITENEDAWSFAYFYAEESWFQLTQANEEREQWGSTYADQIRFWADDVGKDPTGMFSYYLISTERSVADAMATMQGAGVSISDPCANYRRVWSTLVKRSAQPSYVEGAALECGLQAPAVMRVRSLQP